MATIVVPNAKNFQQNIYRSHSYTQICFNEQLWSGSYIYYVIFEHKPTPPVIKCNKLANPPYVYYVIYERPLILWTLSVYLVTGQRRPVRPSREMDILKDTM